MFWVAGIVAFALYFRSAGYLRLKSDKPISANLVVMTLVFAWPIYIWSLDYDKLEKERKQVKALKAHLRREECNHRSTNHRNF